MKWSSPQVVSALGSLLLGFILCYIAFFLSSDNDIPDGPLWVLGQAFIYAAGIFGVTVYVDGKIKNLKKEIKNETTE